MAKVLVIGDVHEPATHPGYLAFCQSIREKWKTKSTVFIGDILDFHAISFHPSEPDALGPDQEADVSLSRIQRWYHQFTNATICIGNHDERVYRLASSVRIPGRFIRDYKTTWKTPRWNWVQDVTIDGVHYHHGTGLGGQQPALTAAKQSMKSTCVGHTHSTMGVRWTAGPDLCVFGMDTGCGVDVQHVAMRYGKNLFRKPCLGCGVVIDGVPYHEIMPMARGQKFHRSRFSR